LILTAEFGDALVTNSGVTRGVKLAVELDIERFTFFVGTSGNPLNFVGFGPAGFRLVDFETAGFKFARLVTVPSEWISLGTEPLTGANSAPEGFGDG
jgi:hypothetical protein